MHLIKELKQKDYDKYLAVLLTPKEQQKTLAALFLFADEISQIPAEVSEPMIGLIKLQWWRDALAEIINGQPPRPHPILKSLVETTVDFTALKNFIDNGDEEIIRQEAAKIHPLPAKVLALIAIERAKNPLIKRWQLLLRLMTSRII